MSKKKDSLGEGIRALLGDIDMDAMSTPELDKTMPVGGIQMIPLTEIEVNPFQPRMEFEASKLNELAQSIKIHGVIQPITLRERKGDEKYQLIAGERRLRASKLAGNNTIPAFIKSANDQEMLEMALIENIQREDLNAMEIAINYKRLIDECKLKHEEMAERVGKTRSTVTNYLRLIKLPPDVQAGIKQNKISMGHARVLAGMDKIDHQLFVYQLIIKDELSVRATERLSKNLNTAQKKTSRSTSVSADIKHVQDQLANYLETKVVVKAKTKGKGTIVINYFSNDDLNRLIGLIEK